MAPEKVIKAYLHPVIVEDHRLADIQDAVPGRALGYADLALMPNCRFFEARRLENAIELGVESVEHIGIERWEDRDAKVELVTTALRQIDRIEFRDAAGPIASEGWVVASRWATVDNARQPVIMTVDPRNEGRLLSSDEARTAEGALRVDWYAGLLAAAGQEAVAERLRSGAPATADDDRGLARVGDTVGYAALAIDGAGLFPMAGDEREDMQRALLRFARDRERKTALIIIDRNCVEAARSREINDGQAALKSGQHELPAVGEIVEQEQRVGDRENLEVTQDGVTLTWEADRLDLKAV